MDLEDWTLTLAFIHIHTSQDTLYVTRIQALRIHQNIQHWEVKVSLQFFYMDLHNQFSEGVNYSIQILTLELVSQAP